MTFKGNEEKKKFKLWKGIGLLLSTARGTFDQNNMPLALPRSPQLKTGSDTPKGSTTVGMSGGGVGGGGGGAAMFRVGRFTFYFIFCFVFRWTA